MSLIRKVAAKAHNSTKVVDSTGVTRPLKLLNFLSSGTRLNRLDAVAVSDYAAGFLEGTTILFPDNDEYIISRITQDYYKNEFIRVNMELILCNNKVTITRQVVQSNNQGGVLGHVDTIIYADVPCKVIPATAVADKVDDVLLSSYVVIIPSLAVIDINDQLQFAHTYKVGKIEGIKIVTEGAQELVFDRDLRW